ncbi:MAG: hypothetical protein AMXMBFR33_68980 [Candidatus Xenobia bacterium]
MRGHLRSGHSLAEVLVAACLFAALLVTLSWIYVQMTRSQRQADPQAEAARTAVLALERTRAELRDALVLDVPRQAGQVRYRSVLRDAEGRPVTGASLSLEYGPERRMRVDRGVLERLEDGQDPQLLARLGEGGSVTFDRPAGQLDLLQITVRAVVNGREHQVAGAVLLGQQR